MLTSEDGTLAHLAAPEAAALWPEAQVRVLDGGNAAWFAAGLPVETGIENAHHGARRRLVQALRPRARADYEKHARAYLDWEVALVDQIKRDPTIRFRAYD